MAEYNLRDLIEKAKKAKEEKKPAVAEKAWPKEKMILPAQSGKKEEEELAKKLKMLDKSLSEKVEAPKQKKTEPVPEEIAELADPEKKSTVEQQMANVEKTQIAAYGNTKIYKIIGMPLLYYYVPVPRPTASERAIINTIKEAATRLISIAPYKIRDSVQRRNVYHQKIMEILKASPELRIPEGRTGFYSDAVVREMVGYGMIDELVQDDKLEEIMVIGPKQPVYVFHRQYEMMFTSIEFYGDNEIQDLINKIAREVGRRVDISAPLLDARLPDGSRVNATIPPATVGGSTLTIRKFKLDPYSMVDLITSNTLTSEVAAFLWLCVDGMGSAPANILISGGTGSGKTTTLNVLASFIPERERVVSIEDTAELNLPLKHWIRMEARPPGLEGRGEITLDILTKNSLRMRPDRVIVGEVRHDEAFTLFTAMNTGHDGALKGDSLLQFSDGNIEEIGSFVEKAFEQNTAIKERDFEFAEIHNEIKVPCINKQSLKTEHKKITHVWRKKTSQKMFKIKLSGGRQLCLTPDHPIYRISSGLQEVNAAEAKEGDFIAMPAIIETVTEKELEKPYLVGLIYGDGHLGQETIDFVNKEKSLIEGFQKEILPITENKVSVKHKENFSRVLLSDKKLIQKINAQYGMPIGNKTKKFRLEKSVLCAKKEEIALLLRGLFDCESHVNLHANGIEFSTSNPDLASKLPLLLARFGIKASLHHQEKDGKGNIGPYFKISIFGKDNIEKYAQNIGFGHESKRKKLEGLLAKSKGGLDLFPNLSREIKNARLEAGITQAELGAMLGTATRGSINAYETNARAPSRKQLEKICGLLQSETARQLQMLVESDLFFEKIASIKEEFFEGTVYDLTVEGNHNYIANGIIAGNCMGTIHANSPQETVVRITSPPMNVPEIMLSGLDLIIIEHRIHDKKKGTIRRITEIAELTGVLEGKAQTQTIFERNPVEDTIERTNIPSNYLKKIETFTGQNRKQVETELAERKRFLDGLAKKNIRSMPEVSKLAQDYLLSKRESNG